MNEWQKIVNVVLKEHVPTMNPQVSMDWSCMCGIEIDEVWSWKDHLIGVIGKVDK